jgi:SpoIIAA-like
MIDVNLDTARSILRLRPKSAFEAEDFTKLAKTVDPHIEATGGLRGIIIEATGFPGWESLGAMASHFKFVRDHHKHVEKIAVVTDSKMGDVAERLGAHFIAAQVRHFPAGQAEAAERWIAGGA